MKTLRELDLSENLIQSFDGDDGEGGGGGGGSGGGESVEVGAGGGGKCNDFGGGSGNVGGQSTTISDIQRLDLGYNNISSIHCDTFVTFGNIEELNLHHNKLEHIPGGM